MVLIKFCTSVMKLNKQSIMVIIHVQLVHIELFKLYVLSAMVIHVIHVQGVCRVMYRYLLSMVRGSCPPLIDEASTASSLLCSVSVP